MVHGSLNSRIALNFLLAEQESICIGQTHHGLSPRGHNKKSYSLFLIQIEHPEYPPGKRWACEIVRTG